jgi:hypothetical protein
MVSLLLLAGCASDPNRRSRIIKHEVSRMSAPSEKLSSFARYELGPIAMSEAVSGDRRKVAEVNRLEGLLKAKLSPLVDQWNAASSSQGGGTLKIQPDVRMLRVVSGGSRAWMGAWAGDSYIDMELGLIEVETGKKIGRPSVSRLSNTNWLVGTTDRNLATYIVDIAYQYLVAHY